MTEGVREVGNLWSIEVLMHLKVCFSIRLNDHLHAYPYQPDKHLDHPGDTFDKPYNHGDTPGPCKTAMNYGGHTYLRVCGFVKMLTLPHLRVISKEVIKFVESLILTLCLCTLVVRNHSVTFIHIYSSLIICERQTFVGFI